VDFQVQRATEALDQADGLCGELLQSRLGDPVRADCPVDDAQHGGDGRRFRCVQKIRPPIPPSVVNGVGSGIDERGAWAGHGASVLESRSRLEWLNGAEWCKKSAPWWVPSTLQEFVPLMAVQQFSELLSNSASSNSANHRVSAATKRNGIPSLQFFDVVRSPSHLTVLPVVVVSRRSRSRSRSC